MWQLNRERHIPPFLIELKEGSQEVPEVVTVS